MSARARVLVTTDIDRNIVVYYIGGPNTTWVLDGAPRPDLQGWGGRYVRIWGGRTSRIAHPATRADVVEAFGVVEILAPVPAGWGDDDRADLTFDGRTQGPFPEGIVEGDHLRFRLSPRDVREMDYEIRSSHPALDGQRGSFTAALPGADRWRTPSAEHRYWWCDDLSHDLAIEGWPGAATIARPRREIMRDFAARLARTTPRF